MNAIPPTVSDGWDGATSGWPLKFNPAMLGTNVYIDGFNLYYGALRKAPYRWLDLRELCRRVIGPGHELGWPRPYTAELNPG